MTITNRQKELKETKLTPRLFAKAIQSLDLSAMTDPKKKKQAIIERVFEIMKEEIIDPVAKKKLKDELEALKFHKRSLGI